MSDRQLTDQSLALAVRQQRMIGQTLARVGRVAALAERVGPRALRLALAERADRHVVYTHVEQAP